MFPLTIVPAYNLPVYASQRPLPDATQDSVRGCSLGFTAAVIADGRLQRACKAQRSSNRTCRSVGYSPILLLKPFGFRITPDTLSSIGLRRWPARHYPRLWIQHPSSERRRDFNPPDSCAAQRTLRTSPPPQGAQPVPRGLPVCPCLPPPRGSPCVVAFS